jgi:hypothetical protein
MVAEGTFGNAVDMFDHDFHYRENISLVCESRSRRCAFYAEINGSWEHVRLAPKSGSAGENYRKMMKQQQVVTEDGEEGPAAVSGGANDVKNQSQNPKWKGRGKDGSTGGGGGGGGGKEGPTCFVCGKAGHKFRDMNKTNGKRYHTEEEIRKAQDGAKLRAGFGSGGGKGAIARSGGAAEGSAPQMFAGMSREEIAFRVAQEKAAMTEAYLRWQDSKVSGPAAAADSNGGFGF